MAILVREGGKCLGDDGDMARWVGYNRHMMMSLVDVDVGYLLVQSHANARLLSMDNKDEIVH
jgi:hypothetical protein